MNPKTIATGLLTLALLFTGTGCGRCGDFVDAITGVQDPNEVIERWQKEDAARDARRGYPPRPPHR